MHALYSLFGAQIGSRDAEGHVLLMNDKFTPILYFYYLPFRVFLKDVCGLRTRFKVQQAGSHSVSTEGGDKLFGLNGPELLGSKL